MDDSDVALLPHTLRTAAAESLADELSSRIPDLEVRIADTDADTLAGFEDATIVVTMGFEEDWYDHLGSVQWVQALTAGYDHYDLDRFEAEDVILTNASGVHADPIAQQVLGYMLMFERNLHRAVRQQSHGEWDRFGGGELGGKTLGIIGTGAIGSQVATVCSPYEMDVIGTKRDTSVSIEHVDRLLPPEQSDELYPEVDYLVLACPLTDETRGLIDADALELMPPESILINIARGEVVDEAALIQALETGQIAGAALDVFEEEPLPEESPLWDLENVIITPHMAGSTPHYWERCSELIADNYPQFESGSYAAMNNRIV